MRLLFPQLFWRLRVVALSLSNINGLIQDGDFILQPHRHARKLIEPPWNRALLVSAAKPLLSSDWSPLCLFGWPPSPAAQCAARPINCSLTAAAEAPLFYSVAVGNLGSVEKCRILIGPLYV